MLQIWNCERVRCFLRNSILQTSSSSFLHFSSPFYRIHLKGYSGTAGKISSIGQPGSDFSTKDADNDKCVCKCSQLTTGGKKHSLVKNFFCNCAKQNPQTNGDGDKLWNKFPPTQIILGTSLKNLQGHLKGSCTFLARSKSTISSELITDQLVGGIQSRQQLTLIAWEQRVFLSPLVA